jgi:hypothetical protein
MVTTDSQKRAIKKYRQGKGLDLVRKYELGRYHTKADLDKHIKQLMRIDIN